MPPSAHSPLRPFAAPCAENAGPLATQLERRRLAHRAARIRRALEAMRQLASGHRDGVPTALRLGMTDFGRELQRVERRLRELDAA